LSGHEDWIKSLAFSSLSSNRDEFPLTLASGSQDGTIRLWTVIPATDQSEKSKNELEDHLLDAFEASLGDVMGDESGKQISMKQHLIKVKDQSQFAPSYLSYIRRLITVDSIFFTSRSMPC
jgi:elongator complex protein 2